MGVRRNSLVGKVVEIHGAPGRVRSFDPRGSAEWPKEDDACIGGEDYIDCEGLLGRCLAWHSQVGKYIVHVCTDRFAYIPEQCLKPARVLDPTDGGFDLLWPSSEEGMPVFAAAMGTVLQRKGWCLVRTFDDKDLAQNVLTHARTLPSCDAMSSGHTTAHDSVFHALPAELSVDLFGHGSRGKVAFAQAGEDADPNSDFSTLPGDSAPFDVLTHELEDLADALDGADVDLGFSMCGRLPAMVWMPFDKDLEEASLKPSPLTEKELEAGPLRQLWDFLHRRKLCMIRWISNAGGELKLSPLRDEPRLSATSFPTTLGGLLVFRCDWFNHSYLPRGVDALAMCTWILDEGPKLAVLDPPTHQELVLPNGMASSHDCIEVRAAHARVPGGCNGFSEQWSMHVAGTDAFTKIPFSRFDTDLYCAPDGEHVGGKSYVVHASLLADEDVVMFDHDFFGICAQEAKQMAPAQRLILENGYATLCKAGFTKQSVLGRDTGVYVGDTGTDWSPFWHAGLDIRPSYGMDTLANDIPYGKISASAFLLSGVNSARTACRLSYCLGLRGTSVNVDTACSASLVGVLAAVRSLRETAVGTNNLAAQRSSDDFLCMGISTLMSPVSFIALCGPSMLSKKGRCFTFDVSAEGYARGDGFGAVYVRQRGPGDIGKEALATFAGVCVNQDGRSATLTAPSGAAQQACIKQSMREAGIVASQVSIAECHGTGTPLGDPIEVGAMLAVMDERTEPLLSTTAKTNVGHLEACAGIVGLLKSIHMALTSACAPNVHLRILNPHLDVTGFPIYFCTEVTDVGRSSSYAGVSSFGFSGTNARADIWAHCQKGPRSAFEQTPIQPASAYVHSPVTMGLVDFLTGKPGVLKNQMAHYDAKGCEPGDDGRHLSSPPGEQDEEPPPGTQVFISFAGAPGCLDEMEHRGGGWHTATIVLEDCRYERFNFRVKTAAGHEGQSIQPVIDDADQHIAMDTFSAASGGSRHWLIDARDSVAASCMYKVTFRLHSERMVTRWEPVADIPSGHAFTPKHSYWVAGSWTLWDYVPLAREELVGERWCCTFRIGFAGSEEFKFSRDCCAKQLIYPAETTEKTTVPMRGPDGLGAGKHWVIRGPVGTRVLLELVVRPGRLELVVDDGLRREPRMWQTVSGWCRHDYCLIGSFNDWSPQPFALDSQCGGRFYARGIAKHFNDVFHVVVDGDLGQALYPQANGAASGELITLGPDNFCHDRSWQLDVPHAGALFQVTLDLTTKDRRNIVTWIWL